MADPLPNRTLAGGLECQLDPVLRYRQQPGWSAVARTVTRDEMCDRHRFRVGYDEGFALRAGIAQRDRDGRGEILDRQHGSLRRHRSEGKRDRQARKPVDGREVSLLAFAVDHDRTQDCKRNSGR